MASNYITHLQMKKLLADLPKSFIEGLPAAERAVFKKITSLAESLKPAPTKTQKFKESNVVNPVFFDTKRIIFCLTLKKIYIRKTQSFVRYCFAMISCLFKEFKRVEGKKQNIRRRIKKEPVYREVGVLTENLTNREVSDKKKELKAIYNGVVRKKQFWWKMKFWMRFNKPHRNGESKNNGYGAETHNIKVLAKLLKKSLLSVVNIRNSAIFFRILGYRSNLSNLRIKKIAVMNIANCIKSKIKQEQACFLYKLIHFSSLSTQSTSPSPEIAKSVQIKMKVSAHILTVYLTSKKKLLQIFAFNKIFNSRIRTSRDPKNAVSQLAAKLLCASLFTILTVKKSLTLHKILLQPSSPAPLDEDNALSTQKNRNTPNHHDSKSGKQSQLLSDSENIEDFEYKQKKNTKMTKRKVQLLRSSKPEVKQIEVISKNHAWVQAFALLKWKRLYYASPSVSQSEKSINTYIFDLLNIFKSRYERNLQKFSLETLKLSYQLKGQNLQFKCCILDQMFRAFLKTKTQLLVSFGFRAISVARPRKQIAEIDMLNMERFRENAVRFYKIIKKFAGYTFIKFKISAFLAIQNHQKHSIRRSDSIDARKMFATLQKMLFIRKYMIFLQIKEEVFINYRKIEYFSVTVEEIVQLNIQRQTRDAFFNAKLAGLGNVHTLVTVLSKLEYQLQLTSAFDVLLDHAIYTSNYIHFRNSVITALFQKTYIKRMSSAVMYWQNFYESCIISEELGLSSRKHHSSSISYEFSEETDAQSYPSSFLAKKKKLSYQDIAFS